MLLIKKKMKVKVEAQLVEIKLHKIKMLLNLRKVRPPAGKIHLTPQTNQTLQYKIRQ